LENWGVRVSGSKEEKFKPDQNTINILHNAYIRDKSRYSAVETDSKSPLYGFKIDMTMVSIPHNSSITYEVELEVLDRNIVTPKKVRGAVGLIYMIMQDSRRPISQKYKEIVIKNYNSLFLDEKWLQEKYKIYALENKPLPLSFDVLLGGEDYFVTPKFDGERKRLFFDVNGVFIINNDNTIAQAVSPKEFASAYVGTIIDTEYMPETGLFYPFDCLVFEQENLTTTTFAERKAVFEKIKAPFIAQKPFFHQSSIFKSINECFSWMDDHSEHKYDGFVAQPNNMPYKNKFTQKWKPQKQTTIDFRVVYTADGRQFSLFVGTQRGEEIFTGTPDRKIEPRFPVSMLQTLGKENFHGKIVEFSSEGGKLKPYRVRDDKNIPNYIVTAKSTWKLMNHPITKNDLLGETLTIYRRYANLTKNKLIENFVPKGSVVLDIGSGRGGDLWKWNEPEMVYSIDVDQSNINEFNKRIQNLRNKNNFRVGKMGGQETAKILEFMGDAKANVVTSFFSLTFFPKSSKMYEGLIETIDKVLANGGRFVGVTMDGMKTREKLEAAGSEIDTPLYKIEQVTEFDDNPIGNEITIDLKEKSTMVHDQTEYLVYFDYLVSRLEDIGIRLVESRFLDEGMQFLPKSTLEFASYNRTFVFERTDKDGKDLEVVTKKVSKESGELLEAPIEEKGSIGGSEVEEHAVFVPETFKYSPPLLFGESKQLTLGKYTFNRKGVVVGNNSFFHSIYYLLSKKYRDNYESQDRKALDDYICEQRKAIGKRLNRDIFEKLMDGNVAHNIAYDLLYSKYNGVEIETPDQAEQVAFEKYKTMIANCDEWVGDDIALHFAEKMKVNIHVFDLVTHRKTQSATVNDAKYDIAIVYVNNVSYEPLVYIDGSGEESRQVPSDL